MSNSYIKNKKFPDKAIDILDEVCVLSSFESNKDYSCINSLDKKLNNLVELKNQSLLINDFKKAIEYSHEENKIYSLISKYQKKLYNVKNEAVVSEKDLMLVMENKTNMDAIKPVLALCKENGFNNPNEIDDLGVANTILSACK